MLARLKEYITTQKTMHSQVFLIVLIVGALTALLSTLATVIEGIGPAASISTLLCFVAVCGIFVLAFVFGKESLAHILLCVVLDIILIPITFFFCGGVRSGMVCYFLSGLYIIVPSIEKRWLRAVIYIVATVAMATSIILSVTAFPHLVEPMDDLGWYIDVVISFVLNAGCIFYVSSLTVRSYEREHRANEELLEKLEKLSVRDELTGLYNRRELFRVMEDDVMEAPSDDHYEVFMFDVDDFKVANDSLGHVFGDKVLKEVANCLQEVIREENGEIAARFGGEEFVAIFHTNNFEDAYGRAEKVRMAIERLRFVEDPEYRITISGGVDHCNGIRPRRAIRQVDELLYIAKQAGKNQITRGE